MLGIRTGRLDWSFLGLGRGLALVHGLGAELLREPLDAALGVDQFLAAGEERVAVRADFEVQLVLGGSGLPSGSAGAARLDHVILRVNSFLHGRLLAWYTNL